MRPATVETPRRRGTIAAGLALVGLALAVYVPALSCRFIWDDDQYLTANSAVQRAAGIRDIWFSVKATPQYYPLTFTTFWLEHRLWGLDPVGYHLVNVLLHGWVALLVWRVLRRLAVPGAWFAAAVFAVHPVHVESVAWVTERKNVLSGVFALAALLAYLRFALERRDWPRAASRWRWYGLCVGLFVCGLLSKAAVCVLPAVMLVLVAWKRRRLSWGDVRPVLPLAVLSIASGWLTVYIERSHVRAVGADWALGPVERVLVAGRALWFYAAKLVWPEALSFVYPRWQIDAAQGRQYLFPAAAVALVVTLWLTRRRWGRGPLVALLIFGGSLLPVLGFINVYYMRYSFVADHFQYLPSIALIALLTAVAVRGLSAVDRRLTGGGERGDATDAWATRGPAAFLVIGALGLLTWRQARPYRDTETIFQDVLAKNPSAWMAHDNLGFVSLQQGRVQSAIEHFQAALRIRPGDATLHHKLGDAYGKAGQMSEVVRCYREALLLKPDYADVHSNLGVILTALGSGEEGISHCREAVRLAAANPAMHVNLGSVLAQLGRRDEAKELYHEALRLQPEFAGAVNNLAWLLATDAAASPVETAEAVRLAESLCARTRRLEPQYLDTLAVAYAAVGRFADAVATARDAIARAEQSGQTTVAADIRPRLSRFEQGRAYHGL